MLQHDPHVCERCARQGPTCCRLRPGSEQFCFPLSRMEWSRILEFSGEQGVFAREPNTAQFVDSFSRLFPRERESMRALFPEHRFHTRLATDSTGACAFLGPGGCELPREARPYYCRLFPFWIIDGRLTVFTSSTCLATREVNSVNKVLEIMGMSEASIRLLYGRMRMSWGLDPVEDGKTPERQLFGQKR